MERNPKHLTLTQHLEELRVRLIKSLIFFVAASCLFFRWSDDALSYLARPLDQLVFTSPTEAFTTKMVTTLLGGLFLSIPYILYHAWQFVYAGLHDIERKYTAVFIPFSIIFFGVGCAFGYVVVLPYVLRFFLSFSTSALTPMITVGKYVSFAAGLVLSFGLIFELPLVVVLLTKIGILTPEFLKQKRRYAIVLIFVVSAVLTPPDFVSQIFMAIPLLVLYEISILLSRFVFRLNAKASSVDFS